MTEQNGQRYHWAQIALHWGVVALIVSQYVTSGAIARTHHAAEPSRIDLLMHSLHNRTGLLILCLTVLRIAFRLARGASGRPETWRSLTERLAGLTHAALYAAVLAQATTGVVASYFWGPMAAAHRVVWVVLLSLIALHVAAALWHHLVRRDATLRRMLPVLRSEPRVP